MTNNTGDPHTTTAGIDNVDVFAQQLYHRARAAGDDFSDVASVVRSLHTVLKHLRVETEDSESLLNSDHSSVYARQLTPIIEDSEFTLKQLDTILQQHGSVSSFTGNAPGPDALREVGARERDMISLIRTKLANQKTNIDLFLDTVQLHNPSKAHHFVDTNSASLDSIKDKVDDIAGRICARKHSEPANFDEETTWLRFRDELAKEGFSRDILSKNQEVLRAYVRQVDEQALANDGCLPTVRGFLEGYQPSPVPPATIAGPAQECRQLAAPPYPMEGAAAVGELDSKEMYPNIENEKFFPSMKMERLQPDKHPITTPVSMPNHATTLSYNAHSSEDDDGSEPPIGSTALISTRDLMALDKRSADLAIAIDNMHLQLPTPPHMASPHGYSLSGLSPGSSPSNRFLPPNTSTAGLLESSPNLLGVDQFSISPRHVPSVPPPPYGSSPPLRNPHSISAPALPGQSMQSGLAAQNRYSRLAPDSQGHEIPLDAKWTRIKRSLVSPEVLAQAGVRYEARPEFVAILGELSREDIAEFARRSAEVRASRVPSSRKERRGRDRYYPEKYRNWDVEAQQNNGARKREDSHVSSSSDLLDSSDDDLDDDPEPPHYRQAARVIPADGDSEKGTKMYPFIVDPPKDTSRDRDPSKLTSPSATSMPKPILKNKNEDPHVRFEPEPQVLEEHSRPRTSNDRERRHSSNRERLPGRDRDHYHRGRHNYSGSGSGGSSSRRDREDYTASSIRRSKEKEDRSTRKKARGETLRAVGIGGAAASLLSVLAEAAVGL